MILALVGESFSRYPGEWLWPSTTCFTLLSVLSAIRPSRWAKKLSMKVGPSGIGVSWERDAGPMRSNLLPDVVPGSSPFTCGWLGSQKTSEERPILAHFASWRTGPTNLARRRNSTFSDAAVIVSLPVAGYIRVRFKHVTNAPSHLTHLRARSKMLPKFNNWLFRFSAESCAIDAGSSSLSAREGMAKKGKMGTVHHLHRR